MSIIEDLNNYYLCSMYVYIHMYVNINIWFFLLRSGMHNWIQVYMEEKKKALDYRGWIKPKRKGASHRTYVITVCMYICICPSYLSVRVRSTPLRPEWARAADHHPVLVERAVEAHVHYSCGSFITFLLPYIHVLADRPRSLLNSVFHLTLKFWVVYLHT